MALPHKLLHKSGGITMGLCPAEVPVGLVPLNA